MTDEHHSLDELGHKIDALKKPEPSARASEDATATAEALRMGTDFIAGIAVGGVLGYFLDRWLDTSPIFLMLCVALGLAAGYRNLMRSIKPDAAGENQGPQTPDDKED